VAAGATLYFAGAHSLTGGASVTGAGVVDFSGGSTSLSGVTYDITGGTRASGGTGNFTTGTVVAAIGPTLTVSGGGLNFTVAASYPPALDLTSLNISGGTLNWSSGAALSTSSLTLSAGTLTGSDTLTVAGATTWTGGMMSGTGVTEARGGLQISGDKTKYLQGRALDNHAEGTWSGGDIHVGYGAQLRNRSGATFEVQCDQRFFKADYYNDGALSRFVNEGTFRKTRTSGTTLFQTDGWQGGLAFDNSGQVVILPKMFAANFH
jgi:hypothetical protein